MKPSDQREPDLSVGYERRDVDVRAVLWLFAGIAISAALGMAGLRMLLNAYERHASSRDPVLSPLAKEPLPSVAPPLQSTPVQDYRAFLARQEQPLNTYGWVDREKKIVRIPIERAMTLLLERGEPEPKATTKAEQP